MNANDNQEIRQLFDEYLQMYASRNDRLTEHFSENFSGFTGGGDFLVKNREEWVAITRQDFAQVKEPLRIELKDLSIQALSDTVAVTTGFFNIHLPIEEHILSRETARLVLIFSKEPSGWKISHSSISIPYSLVREGEVYPLMELSESNQALEKLVAERTTQLSEANINLTRVIEEQTRTEEALRDAEWKFRALFDNGPIGMAYHSMIYDDSGVPVDYFFIDANDSYLKLTGVDPRGKTVTQAFPGIEKDPFDWIGTFGRVAKNGETIRFETCLQTNDRWYDCVSYQYKPEHFVAWYVEITARKKAEIALTESEERFRSLMENIPSVAVQGYALDGTVLFWNPASEKLYGYATNEALGANLLDLIIPDELKEGVIEAVHQMKETGVSIPAGELLLKRKDGSRVPVFSSHALLNPIGRHPEFFCLDIDLTEQKLAEEALVESEYRWKFAVEGAGDGVWDWDIKTGNVKYSRRWKEMLGYDDDDILPTSQEWIDRIHPEDKYYAADTMKEYLEGRSEIYVVEHRLRCKDECYKWILVRGTAVSRNEEGNPSRMIGTISDLTERRESEQEKLKIQKLESLGVLAGGIAHDFNNILTGVIGNISLAKMFVDTTHKSFNALVGAEKASMRATELARQLLTFAKGGDPVKKVFSLQNLVNECVSLVLHGSNVRCTVDIPDSIHAIEADEGQISQALHNIIINATQAMPGGGVITLSARNEIHGADKNTALPPGTYICLVCTDEGCGISDVDLKKIFDPYFTTKVSGTGLGLASTHSIIIKHGGQISVSSQVDRGTTFTILLPSIGETLSEYQTESVSQTVGIHNHGSILVMDDEEMIRDLAATMLEEIGYEVTTCSDGIDAIRYYAAAKESGVPFSAVIMDLTIPGGMGGREAAKEIISIDTSACLIVSSGYSNDPIMSDYSTYGFSGAVAKPYRISELAQILRSALNK
ncbi:MAG: PAS domain S-box protein [Desulfuromonadaceae bacterium]|nr:PAS domain S-box protein [Desulfuromonadaceae bacterium]MDD2849486.1 PAS domain S-box protein [Desulfuromonadaceae bacterium]MDD4130500.1 PAS domain S-box protein [Desulfuromonadaceae bacterium]